MTMNATELRAALAPSVKLFKSIADVSGMLDDVIAEETRLQGLRKEKGDLDKTIAALKSDRDKLTGELAGLKKTVETAHTDLKSATDSATSQRAQMERAQNDHTAKLASIKAAHDADLAREKQAHQTELDTMRSERSGVLAELSAAKRQLADFHDSLVGLKKK